MPEPLAVTLYIPCYNAERFLDETLPAVRCQTHPITEILAIDDGSRDGTAAAARRHGLTVVRHEANRGLGATRNTGVREARTDWVASLDADVRPRSDWLERLAAAVADGRFVGAGGRLVETRLNSLADRWRDRHMRQWWGASRIVNPKFLFGSNTLYRRDALLKAGGCDESCRTNGEDVDLGRRLREAGCDLIYEPSAVCDHLREDSLESIARTYWNWHYHSMLSRPVDDADLRRLRRDSRRITRRLLKRDLRAGRWTLAMADAYIGAKWRGYVRSLTTTRTGVFR